MIDLVGREEELELLLRRWSKAKNWRRASSSPLRRSRDRQIPAHGGAIGTRHLRTTHAAALFLLPSTYRQCTSSNHQSDGAGRWTSRTTTRRNRKLDKLDAVLAQSFTPRKDVALLADMLSLPNDGRYPTLDLTSEQRRQKTLQALTAQLEALSRSNPTLMIFEDVHWIDPTSLEVLEPNRGPG